MMSTTADQNRSPWISGFLSPAVSHNLVAENDFGLWTDALPKSRVHWVASKQAKILAVLNGGCDKRVREPLLHRRGRARV